MGWTKDEYIGFGIFVVGLFASIAIFYVLDPSLYISGIILAFGSPFIFAFLLYIDTKHYENTSPILWAIFGYFFTIFALLIWAFSQTRKRKKVEKKEN